MTTAEKITHLNFQFFLYFFGRRDMNIRRLEL